MSNMRIEVTLGKEGGVKTFPGFQEVLQWTQAERDYWKWLVEHTGGWSEEMQWRNAVWEPFRIAIGEIQGLATDAAKFKEPTNAVGDETLTKFAARIKAAFPVSYADAFAAAASQKHSAVLLTGDPDFKHIETLIDIEWLG